LLEVKFNEYFLQHFKRGAEKYDDFTYKFGESYLLNLKRGKTWGKVFGADSWGQESAREGLLRNAWRGRRTSA
jgi:hypothetical protein